MTPSTEPTKSPAKKKRKLKDSSEASGSEELSDKESPLALKKTRNSLETKTVSDNKLKEPPLKGKGKQKENSSPSPGRGKQVSKDKSSPVQGKGKQSSKGKTQSSSKVVCAQEDKRSKRKTIETATDNGFMSIWTEKRAIPAMDYNESNSKCPLPGCDSKGNIDYLVLC